MEPHTTYVHVKGYWTIRAGKRVWVAPHLRHAAQQAPAAQPTP